jgi:Na+-driven multidrug efflux pump
MTVWLGPSFAQATVAILRILTLGSLAGLVAPLSNTIVQGAGRADLLPKLYLAYFVPYLVALLSLVGRYGVLGAAVAAVLRSLVDSLVLTFLAARIVGLSVRSFLDAKLKRSYALALGLTIGMCVISNIGAWRIRLTLAGLVMVAFLVSSWRYCFEPQEKIVAMAFLSKARLKAAERT